MNTNTFTGGGTLMAERGMFFGICSNCDHSASCLNAKNEARPVWYCEQFDVTGAPKREIKAAKEAANDYHKYSGLCKNCDKRKECGFKKPESGIWHCEEYR